MSTAEYTITLHNNGNSTVKPSNKLFYSFWIKFTAGTMIIFTLFLTMIFSIYAATRPEYLPSALILITTLGVISYLLEKEGERNECN